LHKIYCVLLLEVATKVGVTIFVVTDIRLNLFS